MNPNLREDFSSIVRNPWTVFERGRLIVDILGYCDGEIGK